jgi:HEAT repeat protein
MNAAIALARVNASGAEETKQREVLLSIYDKLGSDVQSIMMKGQLLAVFQHTMDPTFMPLFLKEVRDTKQELPVLRIGANSAYAFLANKAEAETLRGIIAAEAPNVDGGNKKELEAALPALDAAKECDANVACWKGKLADKNALVRRKAAYMLGRLVENDQAVIAALVEVLGDPEITVRNAALFALDRVALNGSPEALAKIDELLRKEQGTVMGRNFSTEAVGIAGRLQARHGA